MSYSQLAHIVTRYAHSMGLISFLSWVACVIYGECGQAHNARVALVVALAFAGSGLVFLALAHEDDQEHTL